MEDGWFEKLLNELKVTSKAKVVVMFVNEDNCKKLVSGWMSGWVDGWMGGWVDGWMGGWVSG